MFLTHALPSVMKQRAHVDCIYVHVQCTKECKSKIKQIIEHHINSCETGNTALTCRTNPTIYFNILSQNDMGPATKLLGVLDFETDPDTRIVTLDDDTIYNPETVATLLNMEPADRAGALGFSCETEPYSEQTQSWNLLDWYNGWWEQPFHSVVDCKGWLHGYQGILYRRWFFDHNVYNMSDMPRGCFYHDDVRIAGYLAQKGIPRRVYPHFTAMFQKTYFHLPGHKTKALSAMHNSVRDYQFPCVNYFVWAT